jgi:hypothetical protein
MAKQSWWIEPKGPYARRRMSELNVHLRVRLFVDAWCPHWLVHRGVTSQCWRDGECAKLVNRAAKTVRIVRVNIHARARMSWLVVGTSEYGFFVEVYGVATLSAAASSARVQSYPGTCLGTAVWHFACFAESRSNRSMCVGLVCCINNMSDHVCLVSWIHGLKDIGRPGVGGSTYPIMRLMMSDRTTVDLEGLLNAGSLAVIACARGDARKGARIIIALKSAVDYITWLDLCTWISFKAPSILSLVLVHSNDKNDE